MKKKHPNKQWKGEGQRSAAALYARDHGDLDGGRNISYTTATLATQKRFVQGEWGKRKASFIRVWSAMNLKAREDLVRAIAPFTPNSPNNPILVINGKQENLQGACIMFPQLCMSELIPENKLIELFDSRTNPSKDELDWIYEDYYVVKSLIERNLVKGNVRTMEKKITFMQPPDKFGESFDIKVSPPPSSMVEWFQKEIIVNASTFGSFFLYQQTIYSFLSGILEEINTEVLNKDDKLILYLDGCAKCKNPHWENEPTTNLKLCTCKQVAYCSKECQKAHWPEHKPNHPK